MTTPKRYHVKDLDHDRLDNNMQRVLLTLLDGGWKSTMQLIQNGGGTSAARRARELREHGLTVQVTDNGSGTYYYRLNDPDPDTIADILDVDPSQVIDPTEHPEKITSYGGD